METAITITGAINDQRIQLFDHDFILKNKCTNCVHQCELTGPSKHEICSFEGKCRSCDNYIDPYQIH